MPFSRSDWDQRIKAVDREYSAVRAAVDRFLVQALANPTLLSAGVTHRDLQRAAELLEGTYIIRLFAEFETALRQFWQTIRDTEPPIGDVIDGVAARCKVDADDRIRTHAVRDYRNALVHEREEDTESIPITVVRNYLCKFLGRVRP